MNDKRICGTASDSVADLDLSVDQSPYRNVLRRYAVDSESGPLEEAVRVLDHRRLEIRQEMFCSLQTPDVRYRVETWFFLPTSLQINRWTYPPTNLQLSLKNYIRLGVPQSAAEALLREKKNSVLLCEADACLDAIMGGSKDTAVFSRYEDCLKRYVLLCRCAMHHFRSRLESEREPAVRESMTHEFVRDFMRCLRLYRRLAVKAARVRGILHMPPFLFGDEYLSVHASEGLMQMVRLLREGRVRTRLMAYATAQWAYRRRQYPAGIPEEHGDNEGPAFRWSILKKYIDMPLFLEIRPREGATFLAHTIYGLAAALAMIFATAVAYIWQLRYGQLSAPLFAALVVGYIFKDRLKDVTRARLFSLLHHWIPDRRQQLYDGRNKRVGRCVESFRFEEWDSLPDDVREVRDRTHFVEVLNSFRSEDVFHYSRDIHIKYLPDAFTSGRRSLLDITRLDISDFLRHAAEALSSPLRQEERLVPGEKTYHVDMVRRVTYHETTVLERFRIVLTSAGIKRIDEIQSLRGQDI